MNIKIIILIALLFGTIGPTFQINRIYAIENETNCSDCGSENFGFKYFGDGHRQQNLEMEQFRFGTGSAVSKVFVKSEGIKVAQYSSKILNNLDEMMDLAATDLWDHFSKRGNYRIAVASIRPDWMIIDDGLFRRVNNAFERALIRTGSESGNILLARSVLLSVIRVLEKEGLGVDPNTVRLKLLDQAIADVIVVAEYHKVSGGIDASFQAVRVKDGHVLAASREYRILFEP